MGDVTDAAMMAAMDGEALDVPLPAQLDQKAAYALAETLLAARGGAVRLNGAAVQRLGGQSLQVMLAGRTAWAAEAVSFVIAESSAELTAALALLGAGELFAFETGAGA